MRGKRRGKNSSGTWFHACCKPGTARLPHASGARAPNASEPRHASPPAATPLRRRAQATLRQLHVESFWRRLEQRLPGEGREDRLLAALQVMVMPCAASQKPRGAGR